MFYAMLLLFLLLGAITMRMTTQTFKIIKLEALNSILKSRAETAEANAAYTHKKVMEDIDVISDLQDKVDELEKKLAKENNG